MSDTHPTVLIIIVTWNKKSYVVDLLNSIHQLTYPFDSLDIVVVDNASTDGTVDTLKNDFPGIHLIVNSENLGGTGLENRSQPHNPSHRWGCWDGA